MREERPSTDVSVGLGVYTYIKRREKNPRKPSSTDSGEESPSTTTAAGVGSVGCCDAVNRHPRVMTTLGSVAAVMPAGVWFPHLRPSTFSADKVPLPPSFPPAPGGALAGWLVRPRSVAQLHHLFSFTSSVFPSTDNKPTTPPSKVQIPWLCGKEQSHLLTNHSPWIDHYTPTNHHTHHIHIHSPP